jgi:poly-beta-1,6-N-acetyl-D-glucosamine N-deacetylase
MIMAKMRRYFRNLLGAFLACGLILFGSFEEEKKKAFSGNKVTALYFHTIDKKLFEKCIRWLKQNGYVFITAEQMIDILKGNLEAPVGAVWITFDDGWQENVDNVVPVAVKDKVPVTFFISTDPVENIGAFWWTYAFEFKNYLPDPYCKNVKKLWRIDENKRRQIIDDLIQRFSSKVTREAMTIQDVKNIANIPQMTIGSHTVHHVIDINCTDEMLDQEIQESKQKLEGWIQKRITTFSYPNGDYDKREKKILMKYGIELAATTDNRFVTPKDDLYYVPRFWVHGDGFFIEAMCQMVGVWNPIIKKLEKIFHLKFDEIFYHTR